MKQGAKEKEMNAYSTIRNTSFATILVAALAGIVSNALALDQQVVFERDVQSGITVAVLPEVVVTASRIET
jgi:hypothetical protein